jgi:hypothetical protein
VSRNVSLSELRTWARQLSDTENDPNITDDELTALANRHMSEVFDRLVDAGPADYYAATTQVTTSDGIIEYSLADDFRNLVGVYVRETSDVRRPLFPMTNGARGNFKAPTGEWTLDIEYIPIAPTLEADGDSFDGVSGFEELIVNLMARDVMKKREADPSVVLNDIARVEARIVSRARSRDKGQPKRITDIDEASDRDSRYPFGWAGSSQLACYRLRADNLELFESIGWWVP